MAVKAVPVKNLLLAFPPSLRENKAGLATECHPDRFAIGCGDHGVHRKLSAVVETEDDIDVEIDDDIDIEVDIDVEIDDDEKVGDDN